MAQGVRSHREGCETRRWGGEREREREKNTVVEKKICFLVSMATAWPLSPTAIYYEGIRL